MSNTRKSAPDADRSPRAVPDGYRQGLITAMPFLFAALEFSLLEPT